MKTKAKISNYNSSPKKLQSEENKNHIESGRATADIDEDAANILH
jgi:hypothetical protein